MIAAWKISFYDANRLQEDPKAVTVILTRRFTIYKVCHLVWRMIRGWVEINCCFCTFCACWAKSYHALQLPHRPELLSGAQRGSFTRSSRRLSIGRSANFFTQFDGYGSELINWFLQFNLSIPRLASSARRCGRRTATTTRRPWARSPPTATSRSSSDTTASRGSPRSGYSRSPSTESGERIIEKWIVRTGWVTHRWHQNKSSILV